MAYTNRSRASLVRRRYGAAAGAAVWLLLLAEPPGLTAAEPPGLRPSAIAVQDSMKLARAVRADGGIRVDGRLADPEWRTAPASSGFVRHNVDPGSPATYPTEVRVLYDDRSLYVGMRMRDPEPGRIAAQLGRRDSPGLHSDWAHVLIDSYRDRRTAYVFSLSPRGVKRDGRMHGDTETDLSWDGVWEGAAAVGDSGWTAEFRIPLSQLRFSLDGDGSTAWYVNFGREVARLNEQSYWSHVPPDAGRFVSLFGRLQGVAGIPRPRRLEVMPYMVGRAARLAGPDGDPFRGDVEPDVTAGVDVRYGVGSNLNLTATINPDFGQVEVDPAVINLTALETFYPERRPFFVEDAELFQRGIGGLFNPTETLFYSRRIGRTPQGQVPSQAAYEDAPTATRILSAAKLSGKTAGGWSLGALHAMTAGEDAEYATGDGRHGSARVEPFSHYAVARVNRDFRAGGSAIGAIGTVTVRSISEDHLRFLPEASYVGGVDWRHRFGADRYELVGWLGGSHVRGHAEAVQRLQRSPQRYYQRPDASHLNFDPERTGLSGAAGDLTLRKIGGAWRTGLLALFRTPGFEANDLGFLQSADQLRAAAWLGYVRADGGRHFRNWSVFTNHHWGWTTGGEGIPGTMDVNSLFQLRNNWQGFTGIRHNTAGVRPDALRGGPALLAPARTGGWLQLATDPRKPVNAVLTVIGSAEHDAPGSNLSIALGPSFRPTPTVSIAVTPNWTRVIDGQQFVATRAAGPEDHHILGSADQRSLSLVTRVNITFSPTLTLELFAQPFVSSVRYGDFKRVGDAAAGSIDRRWIAYGEHELRVLHEAGRRPVYGYFRGDDVEPTYTFADPGFHLRSLRGNAVLRWEYRPGSTLFIVWQQQRMTAGAADPLRPFHDLTSVGRGDGNHVLMLKASYWLGR